MKILIAYSHSAEIEAFLNLVQKEEGKSSCMYKHIHIDFVQTGYTVYETAFAMGKALHNQRYHLVLFAGLSIGLNEKLPVGTVYNVINEIPFSIGRKDANGFEHAYRLGWIDKTEKPHVRGGYINMSNAYFNVFLPFMKIAALTSPQLEGDAPLLAIKTSRFQFHIESSNGMGFHYACLQEGLPFYQIRALRKNAISGEEDKALAIENLNNALIQIIELL